MKSLHQKTGQAIALLLFVTTLFSFTSKWGADSFQIYINKKLVMNQAFVGHPETKSFQLDRDADQIDVYYSHCGQVGKNRSIILTDAQDRVLKQWHFPDGNDHSGMSMKAKEIFGLEKNLKSTSLNLYYSAQQLSVNRLLARIELEGEKSTKP